jgi:uncharacterized repeat protein (TIGR01451 family)
MAFKYLTAIILLILLTASAASLAEAMPEGFYAEKIRLQVVGEDVYAEIELEGSDLKIAGNLSPADFPLLTEASLWIVDGVNPETILWTDLLRLPEGAILIIKVSPAGEKSEVASEISELMLRLENIFPLKFYNMTNAWFAGFEQKNVQIFYSPIDYDQVFDAYWRQIPFERGGFTKLLKADIYRQSEFSMLGVELSGGASTVKLRLIHLAESHPENSYSLKASVKDCYEFEGSIEPSSSAEESTIEISVKGSIITDALLPNIKVEGEGRLAGSFEGIESFPDISVSYSSQFSSQPRLKAVKIVDKTSWETGELVKVIIEVSNVGGGPALGVTINDLESFGYLADYVSLYEGDVAAFVERIEPGSSVQLTYTLTVENILGADYLELIPTEIIYTDESKLNSYTAYSNSLIVGLGRSIASIVSILDLESFSIEGGEDVNGTLTLTNIGEASATSIKILAETGEGWFSKEIESLPATSTVEIPLSFKVYGTTPTYEVGQAITITYFNETILTLENPFLKVNSNSAEINLKSRLTPKIEASKTIDKKIVKPGDAIEVKLAVKGEKIAEDFKVTIYEPIQDGLKYLEGDLTPILWLKGVVKAEVSPSILEASTTLSYKVEVETSEIFAFLPTIVIVKGPGTYGNITFYSSGVPLASASMSIQKTYEVSPPEGIIYVKVSAINIGSRSLANVKIQDFTPSNAEIVDGELSNTTLTLKPSEDLTLNYKLKPAGISNVILPKAEVTYRFIYQKFKEYSDSVEVEVETPSITINKTMSPTLLLQGEEATVTVKVINTGGTPIFNLTVTDTVPKDFNVTVGNLSLQTPILEVGDKLNLNYTVLALADGVYSFPEAKAEYTYMGFKIEKNSNAIENIKVGPKIKVEKTLRPQKVKAGEIVTVEIKVKNLGEKVEVRNVKISDPLSQSLVIVEGANQAIISNLLPGEEKTVSYKVKPLQAGGIPLFYPSVIYVFDGREVSFKPSGTTVLEVIEAPPSPPTLMETVLGYLTGYIYIIAAVVVAGAAGWLIVKRIRGRRAVEEEIS